MRAKPIADPVWLSLVLPSGELAQVPAPAISPDGRRIVFAALNTARVPQLLVRAFDDPTPRVLPGTEGVVAAFWSPDSGSVAFLADEELKRTELDGRAPMFIADAPGFRSGTWGRDDTIVFGPARSAGLFRVSAQGGVVAQLTTRRAGEREHIAPHFLPNGDLLFTVLADDPAATGVYLHDSTSGQVTLLLPGFTKAEYSGSRLLYGRDGSLFAQPLNIDQRRLTGEPVRLVDNLGMGWGNLAMYAFSSSASGALAFWEGGAWGATELALLDNTGRRLGRLSGPADHIGLALSPNERRVALERWDRKANSIDIWVAEVQSPDTMLRVTSTTNTNRWGGTPVWNPIPAGFSTPTSWSTIWFVPFQERVRHRRS